VTTGEGGSPGHGGNDTADDAGEYANITKISEIQLKYILENFPGAAAYPPRQPGDSGPEPLEFVYRRLAVLTRDEDLQSVLSILDPPRLLVSKDEPGPRRVAGVSQPIPGLSLIELASDGGDDPVAEARILFSALEAIELLLGPGKAAPDHMMSVTQLPPPATNCPATEPDQVPGDAAPQPGISRSCCDGRGVRVAVVDTGLVPGAPAAHPWLHGVEGERDLGVNEGTILPYAGHGTFIASIVRAMAPRAEVRVTRMFEKAGALYESDVVKALMSVLDWAPDVISLSAGSHTWRYRGLLSFYVFVNGPLRECRETVLVAAAGNDGMDWKFSPAEMDDVLGVGALGPPGDARAWFSNHGDWVKVYAPGQDLVHAFARGLYSYRELRAGQTAEFFGMARWSGTSFSTPVVSGLVAARISGTGESPREAAESLLRLARAQALPGVGPVLRPGQACLRVCEQPGQDRPPRRRCRCGCDCGCGCG
jgi:subtilisin family serine protease